MSASRFRIALLAFSVLSSGFLAQAQTPFHVNKQLYNETANPAQDIAIAEKTAIAEHKNILLDFGGNWCGDCQVLDYNFHQAPTAALLQENYIVVHIDIGHIDKNLDIAQKYHVQIAHGVPGLAIIDPHGHVLYAQHEKEFEHATPEQLTALLTRYKS